jgi:hypothetical protein
MGAAQYNTADDGDVGDNDDDDDGPEVGGGPDANVKRPSLSTRGVCGGGRRPNPQFLLYISCSYLPKPRTFLLPRPINRLFTNHEKAEIRNTQTEIKP